MMMREKETQNVMIKIVGVAMLFRGQNATHLYSAELATRHVQLSRNAQVFCKYEWTSKSQVLIKGNFLSPKTSDFITFRQLHGLDLLVAVFSFVRGEHSLPRSENPNKDLRRRLRWCRPSPEGGDALLGQSRSNLLHHRFLHFTL